MRTERRTPSTQTCRASEVTSAILNLTDPPTTQAMADVACSPSPERADVLPARINPDLNRIMVVRAAEGSFRSWAESLVDLPAGSLFARITGVTVGGPATYSSVQAGRDLHVELHSNLLYINHSCAPTLEFDMERMEVRVAHGRDLRKGDVLTFFYPSTEWTMAQPFECWCGAGEGKCLGRVEGAAKLGSEKLRGHRLNRHIREMLKVSQNRGHLLSHQRP
ncbi:hypothetical protein DL764_000345 [Monosporascus ibericus]|uniref:SET domain-containing protein n=1 Tax=Monosporascus ibericus TaxID=155417 RepID=A0A4V1XCT9_9PEZI|nr:hypothetical protein DL764_000345 [Monosporascus ibericus]